MTPLQALLVEKIRESGVYQADLSRATLLSEKHISQMMTGRVAGSLPTWQLLLDAAGVDVRAGK